MKEILAEAAILDRSFEVLIGGGDNADVDFNFAVAAETIEGLAVEHTQQLDLSLRLQFADLVEEERALVGEFEEPGLGGIGAAERAFFVSEEFALDQVFGKRGAVDVNPGAAAAMGRLMNGAGDEFLAGTGFAGNQDGLGVSRDAVDQTHEFVHDGTGQNELSAVNFAGDDARNNEVCGGHVRLGGRAVGRNGRRNDSDDRRGRGSGIA